MADEQAVAAAAKAAEAAADALARGAVVFPVRSTVGLAALDSKLQANLRRNMGEELFQNYVGALTSVEGPGAASSLKLQDPMSTQPTVLAQLVHLGRTRGWRSLYHGSTASVLKTVPKCGVRVFMLVGVDAACACAWA